jgi:serine/threonine protein kinase
MESADAIPLGPGFLGDLPVIGKALRIADKYRVIKLIGRGGMGLFYKAVLENLDHMVAVKMVSKGGHAVDRSETKRAD